MGKVIYITLGSVLGILEKGVLSMMRYTSKEQKCVKFHFIK